jgi:DNA-binding CsgD family transcriptional regulator
MRDMREQEFLDRLYAAAVEPELWASTIAAFADLVGGSSAWLSRLSVVDGSGEAITARIDPEMPDLYRRRYARLNPFSNVADPRSYMARWRPGVVTDAAWLDEGDLRRTEYYNDFMRPQDVQGCMIVRLRADDLEVSALTINRPHRRAAFSGEALALAERLRPHLARACDLAARLAGADLNSPETQAALDHNAHAVMILDDTGRLRRMNPAAERLTTPAGGFSLEAGRLRVRDPRAALRFDALLGAAGTRDPARRQGGGLSLRVGEARPPLSVTVAPVPASPLPVFGGRPSILVCVSDPDAAAPVSEDRLAALLGLTRAEARAALAAGSGETARQVAARLGVSFHTVRRQMQSAIEKTGVRSKAELAAMVSRLRAADADPR